MTTALWTVGETDQLQTLPLPSLLKKRLVGTTVTFETTGDLHSVQKNLQGLLTGPGKKDGLIGDADQRYFWFAYYNGGGKGWSTSVRLWLDIFSHCRVAFYVFRFAKRYLCRSPLW